MVYTERAEMAAVSCVTSHASAVSTPLRWIFKNKNKTKTRYKNIKKLFTHVESHASAIKKQPDNPEYLLMQGVKLLNVEDHAPVTLLSECAQFRGRIGLPNVSPSARLRSRPAINMSSGQQRRSQLLTLSTLPVSSRI